MPVEVTHMNGALDRRLIPGVLLIAIGLVLLGAQWFDVTGGAVLGAIAAVFLVMYMSTRQYGFLVPGMILGGLAIGVGLQESGYDPRGGLVVLGLGGGFLAIYLVDMFVSGAQRWWPLIPGGILAAVGTTQIAEDTAFAEGVGRLWPLGLVVAGLLVLLASTRGHQQRQPTT
jgi:hypothetical protein